MISSIYGMVAIDTEGLRGKCIESGLSHILLYIGGLLTPVKEKWEDTENMSRPQSLKAMLGKAGWA